jgi:hypothetical protein
VPALGNSAPALNPRDHERPLVSMEGWARFEQRARERRIEKRLAAAQAALRTRRFADCRAALVELGELNRAHPDLERLTLQLTRAETSHRPRFGAYVVAAAFAAVMLAASWVGNNKLPRPSPIVETAPPGPVPETLIAASDIVVDVPTATAGNTEVALPEVVAEPPVALPVAPGPSTVLRPPMTTPPPATITPTAPTPPIPAPTVRPSELPVPVSATVPTELSLPGSSAIGPTVILPAPSPQRVAPAAPPVAATAMPVATPVDAAPAPPVVDDAARVRAVVQKYQAAYDRLDAGLVHEVWPGVNEAALARAFEGLQSQTLTFRACDVQLRGAAATVLCSGSTRYVPKIGSREPHVEPLAWTFTLRKRANDDWRIESARAER